MKRKSGSVSALLIMLTLFTAATAEAQKLKIATLAPDGTMWMTKMRAAAKEIDQRTNGRVQFKFYPGGVMGSDKSVRRKIRIGQLHGGVITSGVLYDVYQDSQLYSLPMVFRDYQDVDAVRKQMDKIIAKGMEKGGFVTFGFAEGGFAYLMSKEPVNTVDDLKTRKVWVPEGDPITRTVFESMGIKPIPLAVSDVYTALQTGMVDTVGISAIGAIALQWHTQVKYVIDAPLMYLYAVLAIDTKVFGKLTAADQAVVREVMERVFNELNEQNRKDNRGAKVALAQQGLTFTKPKSQEYHQLKVQVDKAIDKLAGRFYTKAMYMRMLGHIKASGTRVVNRR